MSSTADQPSSRSGTSPEVDRAAAKEQLFDFLKPVASGIVKTLGPLSEVVLHDFADPEHSIVWIEGNVTGRQLGGSVTEIGLAAIRGGDSQPDLIGYSHNTRDGKILRSSTIMLRDSTGNTFGCLCINIDVTDITVSHRTLSQLFPEISTDPTPARFTDQTDEVLARVIDAASRDVPKPPILMNREEKLAFVAALEHRGAFHFQRSVPTVAQHLRVSRTTIYTYLQEVRSEVAVNPT